MYLINIVCSRSKVKRMIYNTFIPSISKFSLEGIYRDGLRVAIGHIHHRCHSPSGCSTTLGMHVGLLSQAWITKMHMVINTSRYKILPSSIDKTISRDSRDISATYDGSYTLVLYKNASYILLAFIDDGGLVD